MVGASLYIIVCSAKNRALRWLKRLREPRYLAAVVAGAVYFYFVIGGQIRNRARFTGANRWGRSPLEIFPALAIAAPSLAGLGVLLMAAGSWLFPGTGALLNFTPPEVQLLFPAPVTRRMLVVHRLLRSQLGLLFGPIVFAVLVPFGSNPSRIRMAVTLWIVLFTVRVYFSGIALARVRMASRDARTRQLARLPLILVWGALAVVLLPLGRALLSETFVDVDDVLSRVALVSSHGLPQAALWPFVTLVRPAFSSDWLQFVRFLPGALAVAAVATAWVLLNDEVFEDITRELAETRKEQPRRARLSYRARPVGWQLAAAGRAETAFLWKALLQSVRVVQIRVLIRLAIFVVWTAVVATIAGRGAAASLGLFAMIGAAMSTLIGPLILRIDLRQDLQHLEVLKTWPVRAAQLVRGEMLWPAAMLTAAVWSMTALAMYLSSAVFSSASLVLRASAAAAVCLVAPALVAAQLTIHNAAALIFPAWVSFGGVRGRGVDAVGQRLIVVGGTLLLVTLATAPGALLGGITWFAFNRFIGPVALVPSAAICAAAIAVEVLLATEALGPAYDRLDVTSIERSE